MSHFSTSKMLGKLASGQVKSQPKADLNNDTHEVGEVFAVPQLKPSAEPEMKNVLAGILGSSASNKLIPKG